MKNTLSFFLCLFLSLAFSACEKPPVDDPEIEYTISAESLNFDTTGGQAEFTVSVKSPATVESIEALDTWCQVSKNGVSPVNVTVTVAPKNTDDAYRYTSVVIHLKLGDAKTTATVSIIQEGVFVLINGVKWATRNVDAPGTFAANPESAGMFYQPNRRIGWSATDPMINSNGGTMWDSSNPVGDTWEKANDPCPPGWRVPTYEEFANLYLANIDSEWKPLNGVNGRWFGSDDNFLFLPAAEYRYYLNGRLHHSSSGEYWSSTFTSNGILLFSFSNTTIYTDSYNFYPYGCSVRCVQE